MERLLNLTVGFPGAGPQQLEPGVTWGGPSGMRSWSRTLLVQGGEASTDSGGTRPGSLAVIAKLSGGSGKRCQKAESDELPIEGYPGEQKGTWVAHKGREIEHHQWPRGQVAELQDRDAPSG